MLNWKIWRVKLSKSRTTGKSAVTVARGKMSVGQAGLPPRVNWQKICTTHWSPGAREGHTGNIINNKMYIFGGIENGVRVNTTACLDLGE